MTSKSLKYKTRGTCSSEIHVKIDGDIIQKVEIKHGCTGNLQALCRLVQGRQVDEVIALLHGIQCQNGTSCPDQLAQALKSMKENV